jgi:hypothetical protein
MSRNINPAHQRTALDRIPDWARLDNILQPSELQNFNSDRQDGYVDFVNGGVVPEVTSEMKARMDAEKLHDPLDPTAVRRADFQGFTLTLRGPALLWHITKKEGDTPKELSDGSFTSRTEAEKVITTYISKTTKDTN